MQQISLFEFENLNVLNSCPECGKTPELTELIDKSGLCETFGSRQLAPTNKPFFEIHHPCRIGQEGNAFCTPAFWTAAEAVENWNNLTINYVKEKTT